MVQPLTSLYFFFLLICYANFEAAPNVSNIFSLFFTVLKPAEGPSTYTGMGSMSMPTSVIATDTEDDSFIHLDSLYDVGAKVEETPPDFMDGGGGGSSSSLLTDGDPPLVMVDRRTVTVLEPQSQVKEVVSYQRYGKVDKTVFSKQKFKCHLCGFGCVLRDSLLKHFDESHPL